MDPETEKIIEKQMKKLPEEVRSLFTDPTLNEKIINIGKKNGLNVEQLGTLQTETYLVMLGLVHVNEYQNELKNRLNIDSAKAAAIINDTNAEILGKIREKLMQVYEDTDEGDLLPEETAETPAEPAPHKDEKETTAVLKSAGIEIMNGNKQESSLPTKPQVAAESAPVSPILHIMPKEEIHPVLAQKMSAPVSAEPVKTEHSLENITKTSAPVPKEADPGKPRIDPYREIPE